MSLAALMPQEIIHSANSKILLVTDTYVWLYRDEGALFVIHLPSGRIDQIAEGMLAAPTVAFGAVYNQVMVGIDHAVKLMNLDGRLIREIGLEDRKAVGMHFFREKLLVLCDDGKLYRYDREGKLLSQTTLHLFNTFTNYDPIDLEDPMDLAWWVTEDGDLILNVFRAGNIVDCESWEVRAFVTYLSTYSAGSDTLLCMSNARLYAYPRYTTQQQKEKGLQALGDFRLSEELRSYYGLG